MLKSAVDYRQTLFIPTTFHTLGQKERQFQSLIGVEAWVAMGVVTVRQRVCRNSARTAGAFRHILAGHLDMDAAWMRAFGAVNLEEALDLRQNALERTRLVMVERDRVAMHRIARPDDLAAFFFDGADQLW